LCQKKPPIV